MMVEMSVDLKAVLMVGSMVVGWVAKMAYQKVAWKDEKLVN